ncbi:MAG TPA: HAD-IA family hydrolase [Actinomycetota bacterium]|nr:HAD-IA family hydrolase [Actinomycetota bacterium]
MTTPEAVLIDFDGTLWDSETAVFGVFRGLFADHGQELLLQTWSAAIGTIGGFDPYAYLAQLVDGMDVEQARERTEQRIREAVREVPLRPGVDAFLRQLDEAGVRRALVSSDRSEWLLTNLERLGGPEGWAAMVSADGDASRAKPNPHLYEAALELLDVRTSQAFAIEDSPNGIRAAKAAGLPCLCVPNEATARLDLSEADLVVTTFEGLSVEEVWSDLRSVRRRDAPE